jgi:hypothetical protein
VQARGDPPLADDERGLDQAGNSRGRFKVAEIGFHRAEEAGGFRRPAPCQHLAQGPRFDRITDGSARSMRLDIDDLVRFDLRLTQYLLEHHALRGDRGHGHRGGASVLIHHARENRGMDSIPIGESPRERFQQDESRPFAADITVRPRIKGTAEALRGKHPGLAESDRSIGQEDRADSASHRQ